MNTEHTSFSAGKSSSNKKLYLFLNLHTNQINVSRIHQAYSQYQNEQPNNTSEVMLWEGK